MTLLNICLDISNILLSEQDLTRLQVRAAEEGLPYQTLMASILHKYVSGRLVERA